MAVTKYYTINKALDFKEYASMDAAKRLNPDWIIKEDFDIEINGEYRNSIYDFVCYNGSGEVVKEIIDGKWKLTKIICYRNTYFQKWLIGCSVVDPTGRVASVEIKEIAFSGILQAIQKLRKFSAYENLENYLLSQENEKLKKEIEKLKNKLND